MCNNVVLFNPVTYTSTHVNRYNVLYWGPNQVLPSHVNPRQEEREAPPLSTASTDVYIFWGVKNASDKRSGGLLVVNSSSVY